MIDLNKFAFVSNLRAMAVVMVVFYHCLCPFTPIWNCAEEQCSVTLSIAAKFINCISMPLFFAIAGYLFAFGKLNGKYSNFRKFIFAKFNRLIVPFLFWGVIVWFLSPERTIGEFLFYGASHLWFLGTLFLMFLAFYVLKFYKIRNEILMVCILSISIMNFKLPYMGTSLNTFFVYMGHFFIGILFAEHNIKIRNPQILLFASLAGLLALNFFYGVKYMDVIIWAFSLVTVTLIFYNGKSLLNRSIPVALKIEKESMGIYILHHILFQFLLTNSHFAAIYHKFAGCGALFITLSLLFVCYAFSAIARKTPFSKVLG